ncbi:hypothetical protein J4573_13210 [Actinomadura barringtoniae]|uniref:Ribbon-helix-helix protein, CopG family n=1 Tax=Actinomadura barringtoniae TaxID=1427535 RepID=A0A939T1Q8_9ACTN|nr:hypothetical protein [Actinomadura barringtoniae]MBO2448056.1 hypothetical protein [Actinomadura barringtoniae]
MIGTSLRLPKPIMDLVRERAAQHGMRPTAYMRQVIEAAVTGEDIAVPMRVLLAAAIEYESSRKERVS